jgi:hypothetical protein
MMDEIFKKEIKENLIIVYMDDILAFSKTIDDLKKIKWIILEKAQEYDLYFKAKKREFRKPKIEYLGLVVEEGKLAMCYNFFPLRYILLSCSHLHNLLDSRA